MYGFFMYLLTIQGNIIPFLRSELYLGYGAVSLHSSAFAAGVFATGMLEIGLSVVTVDAGSFG